MNDIKPIKEILNTYGINSDICLYGDNIAKINPLNNPKGKLILVTSTNPTPYGEGKTTLSIGITDALNHHGIKASLAIREPSLGPVFGLKGGATGGGKSQVYPSDKINLHFTGDFHAITSANNLIAAIIDNHIYEGNYLDIQEILFDRCIDMNDRTLRSISTNNRDYHFNITSASEIMSIFCLAKDIDDLKIKLDNIIIGKNSKDEYIFLKELNCTDAVISLLIDAMKPNVVSTLNNSLAFIHGGPFANISFGCNSIIATKTALSISDYVITEAGFGSDLGALKFLDIKCRNNDIYPDLIVINSTIRSLKYHGEGILNKGIDNLKFHIENMQKFNDNVLVIINKFESDTEDEISFVINFCKNLSVNCIVSDMYLNGVKNTKEIVDSIVSLSNKKNTKRFDIYKDNDDIFTKINNYSKLFGAKNVLYSDEIKKKLVDIDKNFKGYKICISKTHASITDNKKILGYPKDFDMTITDVKINGGCKFITMLMGNVITLPGLAKNSNYKNIKIVGNKVINI